MPAALAKVASDARDRRLHFEYVLRRLYEQQVYSAIHESLRLLLEEDRELLIRDVRECGVR